MGNDNRKGCWTLSQLNKDIFLKAWVNEIKPTSPSAAVWEFCRKDHCFKPYDWDYYRLNPQINYGLIDNLFLSLQNVKPSHPSTINCLMLIHLFLIHLPIVLVATFLLIMYSSRTPKHKQGPGVTVFVGVVITSSILMIIHAICSKSSYQKKLKEREKSLAITCAEATQSYLFANGMKAKAGSCGAWIEIEFLHPNVYMTRGNPDLGHPLVANEPYAAPVAGNFNPFASTK